MAATPGDASPYRRPPEMRKYPVTAAPFPLAAGPGTTPARVATGRQVDLGVTPGHAVRQAARGHGPADRQPAPDPRAEAGPEKTTHSGAAASWPTSDGMRCGSPAAGMLVPARSSATTEGATVPCGTWPRAAFSKAASVRVTGSSPSRRRT